jgi:tripartite-type tricarboxylate transporter receptor subunit TctC
MFISLVTGTAKVRAGNLRAYGVTSAARQPSFPDLPAIGEIVTGFESEAWFGVFGPAKLPDEIVESLIELWSMHLRTLGCASSFCMRALIRPR